MLRYSCSLHHEPAVVLAAPGGAPPSIRRPRTAAADRNTASPATFSGGGRRSERTAYLVPVDKTELGKRLRVRPSPELGLLSLLFVLSTAIGAMISVALISIPTVIGLKRLAVSMDELVKLVSEEVPGTLGSLKLTGREINDLTRELDNLREWISGNQYGKKW